MSFISRRQWVFFHCIIYPIMSHVGIKWLAALICIFHHACCFGGWRWVCEVGFPSLWWIWAMPLLKHCLWVAQWVWLIDGRQWLSPLESKHFCVVSPLKVLLSLLREKTLFVYSHCDGTGCQLLLKRRQTPSGTPLPLSSPCLSHLPVSLPSYSICVSSPSSVLLGWRELWRNEPYRWKCKYGLSARQTVARNQLMAFSQMYTTGKILFFSTKFQLPRLTLFCFLFSRKYIHYCLLQ